MNYLFLFEDFKTGKFRIEDLRRAWKNNKPIFSSILKDNPDHNKDNPLQIVDIDDSSGEISVVVSGDVYYLDLEDVEKIG
jgi:hypothetical protein